MVSEPRFDNAFNDFERSVIKSEKLTQAVNEFPTRLKVCAKAWGRHIEQLQ